MSEDKLVEKIATSLPSYMHPERKVRLKSMPLNANGKIDRQLIKKEYLSDNGQ